MLDKVIYRKNFNFLPTTFEFILHGKKCKNTNNKKQIKYKQQLEQL